MQRRSALLTISSLLGGCSLNPDSDHTSLDAPSQIAYKTGNKPIRQVWVLSSGGPRGFVHVGIIKALEEIGLQPDLMVGGSVGSLVGALYAAGATAAELERMAIDLGVTQLGRLAMTGDANFNGAPLANLVNSELHSRLGHCQIERLPIRYAAAAIERESRQPILFNCGQAGLAVQASCAIEGQFTPVRIRGQQYVDADLAAPLPVRLVQAWLPAAQSVKVLAMDASAHEAKAPPGSERFRAGDLRKRELTAPDALAATLTLHPEMSYYVNISKEFRQLTIRQGYEQTIARAASIQAALR